MLVCKLTISFDRGIARNDPKDVGLDTEPVKTTDGEGLVRGLGTHYRNEEAKTRAEACEAEDRRIRRGYAAEFVRSPIEGLYVVPNREAPRALLTHLAPSADVKVRVSVFNLSSDGAMETDEMKEWQDRIRRQFDKDARLGKEKFAAEDGLATLTRLAECPVLAVETREELLNLIQAARLEKVERKEFKRRIASMDLRIDATPAVGPRRVGLSRPAATPDVPAAGAV